MDGIWYTHLDIGGTAKFTDLMVWHTQISSTITRCIGESNVEPEEDGLGLSPTGRPFPHRLTTARRRDRREKPMENEKLILALRAGARAIVNNKRLHGAIYCWDIWGKSGGPKEIPYLDAAVLLAKTADKIESGPPERQEDT